MDTRSITPARLADSVIAVPPLARDSHLRLDTDQNRKLIQSLEVAGVNTLLYGGNAVLYHVRLSEYERLLQMLVDVVAESTLVVPSVGPAFGTMMDQVEVLRNFDFPTAMVLPQHDVADPTGIAQGLRRFADAFGKPIVLYIKQDQWLPPSLIGKMYQSGMLSWIKYAVVRDNPAQDDYLQQILSLVPGDIVVSGMGEQPAITHLRDFDLVSFTSGCVCLQPARSTAMLRAVQASQYEAAEEIRLQFKPLEDLRDRINPIRVLHRAVELAGVATTGPMYPMLGELDVAETTEVAEAALALGKL